MRFYRPFKLEYFYKGTKYQQPKSLAVNKTAKLPSKEEYDKLSEDKKTEIFADILKDLAILSARRANLANREKNSEKANVGGKFAYGNKDKHMVDFLIRAHMHNQLVEPEKQIYFGFDYEVQKGQTIGKNGLPFTYMNYLMSLNASIPGYSRLSLHFGRMEMPILKEVNEKLVKMGFVKFPIDRSEERTHDIRKKDAEDKGKEFKPRNAKATIEKLCRVMPYELEKYVVNLGLVSSDDYNNAEKYANQMRKMAYTNGKFNEIGIDDFIYCTGINLNEREIMYLAERAGFGKAILLKIQEKVKERRKVISTPIKARSAYFSERLNESETDEKMLETLCELSKAYCIGLELEDEEIPWAEKTNSFMNQVENKVDKKLLTKWFATTVEDVLKTEADDYDKVAEVLPYVSEANKETLNLLFHQYDSSEIAGALLTENGVFRTEAYKRILMFVDEENRERILQTSRELKSDFGFEENVDEIYKQMLEIAENSEPTGRDEAEAMEQYLLDKNRKKGE